MSIDNRKEFTESEKGLALTLILTNVLILTVAIAIFWLVQFIISESAQLNNLARGFNLL